MSADKQNYLSEQSSKEGNRRSLFRYWLAGFLVIILLCLFALRIYKWSTFRANPNNAYDTVQAFAYSLAYNKLDGVKSYVSEDKWTFIDDWSTQHQAISSHCKSPSDPDDGPFWMGGFDDGSHIISVYFDFREDCPGYFYSFRIDANLERVNNKWQVTDWTILCERGRTLEEMCY
jgi:hypothetical protein